MRSSVPLPVLAAALSSAPVRGADPVDFNARIRPLLSKHCTSCHGPAKQKAGLRLDLGRHVLKGSLNGPVVVPKDSAGSKLIHALKGELDAEQMPPAGPLAGADVRLIARWIDEGAKVPADEKESAARHWAFDPPRQAAAPEGVHPIDFFLEAERAKKGVIFDQPADT